MIPAARAKLLEGKKGLVVGIANENSIAWGCAKAFRAFGAELAVTYLNDKARKYVEPLARELEAPIVMPLDVSRPGQMEAVFERIAKDWGTLDFVVHSIAFSPKEALQGRVVRQHHGRRQGGARKCGAVYRRRARPEGHPCPCHLARTARDAGCLRDSRIRCLARQGKSQGARAQPRQHRGRWRRHRLLAHDAARLITGETLYIDGGYHIID